MTMRYDIYSRTGKLLDSKPDELTALRLLSAWFNAKCVIEVAEDGSGRIVAERKELHE
jgi:hypothetical protein